MVIRSALAGSEKTLETRVIVDKGLSVIHGILNETFVLGIF
jgi:hypothetical protein